MKRPNALAMSALLMAGMQALQPYPELGLRGSTRGWHRGECRKPKNLCNDADRAKGMQPFDVDGVTVYAGTPKAARKKARLLKFHLTK